MATTAAATTTVDYIVCIYRPSYACNVGGDGMPLLHAYTSHHHRRRRWPQCTLTAGGGVRGFLGHSKRTASTLVKIVVRACNNDAASYLQRVRSCVCLLVLCVDLPRAA